MTTQPVDVIEQSRRFCNRGRPDEALLLLREHLVAKPGDESARLLFEQTLRTLRRDAEAIRRLIEKLAIPGAQYRGFSHLHESVFDIEEQQPDSKSQWRSYGRLANFPDLLVAEDALTQGDLHKVTEFLLRCPPAAFPIPWLYFHARLTLASDSGIAAARTALVEVGVAIALMPDCGSFYRCAADAFRRLGNSSAAAVLFSESLKWYERGWLDNLARSAIPISVLRCITRAALVGRPSGTRFLLHTIFLRAALRIAHKLTSRMKALGRAILRKRPSLRSSLAHRKGPKGR